MLLIDVARIPSEGLGLDEALESGSLPLGADRELSLAPGGRLRGRVEVVDETTVHVRGRLDVAVEAECSRCLERHQVALGQELDLFFLPRAEREPEAEAVEVELSDRDVIVGYYEAGQLDLGEVVREQVILGLPLKPLCREDCLGLCPRCGKNRNTGPCGCPPEEESGDPRLEPLRNLFAKKRQ
jgi:uncharacterized protein